MATRSQATHQREGIRHREGTSNHRGILPPTPTPLPLAILPRRTSRRPAGPPPPIIPPVPPASGSLPQAWVSVAFRPSRQNFSAWAQITTRGWVAWSLGLASVLAGLALSVLSLLAPRYIEWQIALTNATNAAQDPTATTIPVPDFSPYTLPIAIGAFVLGTLYYLVIAFAIPFGQSLFMSAFLGTRAQRHQRAMRPWALAQVGQAVVQSIVVIGLSVLVLTLTPSHPSVDVNNVNAGFSPVIAASLSFYIIAIPLGIYRVYSATPVRLSRHEHAAYRGIWHQPADRLHCGAGPHRDLLFCPICRLLTRRVQSSFWLIPSRSL